MGEGMNEYCSVIEHVIAKNHTQQLERTSGIIRQQLGRWRRWQNKFGKLWQQTEVTVRLAMATLIGCGFMVAKKILLPKELRNAIAFWSGNDLITFPTLYWGTTKAWLIIGKEGVSIYWELPQCFGFLERNLDTGFLKTLRLYLETRWGNKVSKISTLN